MKNLHQQLVLQDVTRARVMDLLIASTACTHGAILYTANPKDLVGLEKFLEVIPITNQAD